MRRTLLDKIRGFYLVGQRADGRDLIYMSCTSCTLTARLRNWGSSTGRCMTIPSPPSRAAPNPPHLSKRSQQKQKGAGAKPALPPYQ